MELNNTRLGRWESSTKTTKITIILISVVTLSVVSFVIGMEFERNKKHLDGDAEPGKHMAMSRVTRHAHHAIYNEYRISRNSEHNKCSAEVRPNDKEPKHCRTPSNHRHIKNTSTGRVYYKCGGNSYNFTDILKLLENEIFTFPGCSPRHRVDCCFLSHIGNLMNYCPGDQKYSCFPESPDNQHSTPLCGPPTITFECKCYRSETPVCGEEELPRCDNLQTSDSECIHKIKSVDDTHHRCICNKPNGDDPEPMPSCSKLLAEETNNV